MTTAALFKISTKQPADIEGLSDAVARGLEPDRAVAVLGKTEGNGCVNDFTRGMAAMAWRAALPGPVVTVMSGGTEGVLSPHVSIIARADSDPRYPGDALVAGSGSTEPIAPRDLGRAAQVEAVADAVQRICGELGVVASDVHLVVVKCPLLTSDVIAAHSPGELIARDSYESMARSRAAAALGIALATGEIDREQMEAGLAGDRSVYSSIASTSSGAEVAGCEIVVLANSSAAAGPLRASHVVMRDALDSDVLLAELERIRAQGATVVQIFAKAEADPAGNVRGSRHTMLTDSDIQSTRHARAAVGGLLAGLVGDPALYVSGGAEHQGPPGGGPVTFIWEVGQIAAAQGAT